MYGAVCPSCGAIVLGPTPDTVLDECNPAPISPLDPKLAAEFIRAVLPHIPDKEVWRRNLKPRHIPLNLPA